jgi:hypothetical protein
MHLKSLGRAFIHPTTKINICGVGVSPALSTDAKNGNFSFLLSPLRRFPMLFKSSMVKVFSRIYR